ncbi:unnamed protein product [Ectocarpus fasciculatus]
MESMYITKRDGRKENVLFDKISARIKKLCYGLDSKYVDHVAIAQKVISGVYAGVTTTELDTLAAETAAYMAISHPDYSLLAGRIAVSRLHKETDESFVETMADLHAFGMVADDVYTAIRDNAHLLDGAIDYGKDLEYDFFAFKTLEKSYLLKIDGKIVERIQHMLMRVAVGIHKDDIESVLETYTGLSERWMTHATPTLFNAGTVNNQLSSCFLLAMQDDSVDGIYDTLKQTAKISKFAGGIGLSVSNIRAKGSYIKGTNGVSDGIVPLLRCFESTARFINQAGRRKGSFAMYLEMWHADILEFLDLKKNNGNELMRARDLFYGLWVSDLFMHRVKADGDWTLLSPSDAPDLIDLHGADFDRAYHKYESDGIGKTIKARTLFAKVVESQIETGGPYYLFKDACNAKSNQQHLGTIRSSNLCAEVIQYSSREEIAVCNLASINLVRHVKPDKTFDFERLHRTAKQAIKNLNKVIDVNFYPLEECGLSNMRHRPCGLGVQALHDVYMVMGYPFESAEAATLNKQIFETIYHGSVEASIELAKIDGPYESFQGSPASFGKLQFDLWGHEVDDSRHDWTKIKADLQKHGMRNSLLTAVMPTASSASFCSGGTEAAECSTAVLYNRRVLSGEFPIVNKYLIKELITLGLWDGEMKNAIIRGGGSVQGIESIPEKTRMLFKNVWEVSQKTVIEQAAARGPFIDQSQSMNIFFERPTMAKISSALFYGWELGLKTGGYYVRSRPVADPVRFTVPSEQSVDGDGEDEKECLDCSA